MLKSLFVKEKEQPVYEFVYEVEEEKESGSNNDLECPNNGRSKKSRRTY